MWWESPWPDSEATISRPDHLDIEAVEQTLGAALIFWVNIANKASSFLCKTTWEAEDPLCLRLCACYERRACLSWHSVYYFCITKANKWRHYVNARDGGKHRKICLKNSKVFLIYFVRDWRFCRFLPCQSFLLKAFWVEFSCSAGSLFVTHCSSTCTERIRFMCLTLTAADPPCQQHIFWTKKLPFSCNFSQFHFFPGIVTERWNLNGI